MSQAAPSAKEHEGDPLPTLLWVTALVLLVLGWLVPITLVVLLLLITLFAALGAIWFLPRFVIKLLRENCERGGVLEAWRPNVGQVVRTVVLVLAIWLPCGVASVVVFHANGLLVKLAITLTAYGVEQVSKGLDVVDDGGTVMLNDAHWLVKKALPGEGADLLCAFQSGVRNGQDALAHLLALLLFLLVLEGVLSWVFLVWLTVRTVLYLFARQILAELSPRRSDGELPAVHFRMGFDR